MSEYFPRGKHATCFFSLFNIAKRRRRSDSRWLCVTCLCERGRSAIHFILSRAKVGFPQDLHSLSEHLSSLVAPQEQEGRERVGILFLVMNPSLLV